MEIDWRILSLTAYLVIAVAVVGIVTYGVEKEPGSNRWRRRSSGGTSATSEARSQVRLAGLVPHLALFRQLYQQLRQPVWPISRADLQSRLGLGFKIAFWISVPAVLLASHEASREYWLVVFVVGVPIAMVPAAIASVVHTIVLRLLPLRGFATSVALAILIGLVLVHSVDAFTGQPGNLVLVSIGIYGIVIGLIAPPDEDMSKRVRRRDKTSR